MFERVFSNLFCTLLLVNLTMKPIRTEFVQVPFLIDFGAANLNLWFPTFMPGPFWFDINFGNRLYSKEKRRAWPLLCYQIWYQINTHYMDRAYKATGHPFTNYCKDITILDEEIIWFSKAEAGHPEQRNQYI